MARRKTPTPPRTPARPGPLQRLRRGLLRIVAVLVSLVVLAVAIFGVLNPPSTPYMIAEGRRLGGPVDHEWVPLEQMAPAIPRAVVAAEDADFCTHWGFDLDAIRSAIAAGGARGASTISQQTVKNVFLWQGRSWPRKALEAALTPLAEALWTKRRMLEIYLNVAEFGEGTFGIEAAAWRYFRAPPDALTDRQAALLAAILPDPKGRSAADPSDRVARRARAIRDGAATIAADGRATCFAPD